MPVWSWKTLMLWSMRALKAAAGGERPFPGSGWAGTLASPAAPWSGSVSGAVADWPAGRARRGDSGLTAFGAAWDGSADSVVLAGGGGPRAAPGDWLGSSSFSRGPPAR